MSHAITICSSHDDELLFAHMAATERLGELFTYQLRFLCANVDVDLRKLLGTPMAVKLEAPDAYTRYFNGIVSAAGQTGFQTIDDVRYAVYEATVVPKPWLLTRQADCRIFSQMTVPDIVQQVLRDVGYADVKLDLNATYPVRDYCVQYREDSFNFISRLMQQEGIYYYFTHTAGAHTMVLADALGAHAVVDGFATIHYNPSLGRATDSAMSIREWTRQRAVQSLQYQLDDYDPLKPKTSLLATESVANGSDYHGVSGLDVYDYPGAHLTPEVARHYAQVRVEARNAPHDLYRGRTNARGLATGALFTLKDFPQTDLNREYLVVGTSMELEESGYASGATGGDPFTCNFEAIKSAQPYRSQSTALKPHIVGLQTAVVSGQTDEDIVVDQYGRVQVTFHWSRAEGEQQDAPVSCWVRVASPWAGKAWGAVSIPRVGQEVVVSFLEGDPDRPLIIGSVYNAVNTVPYALPDNKTQSGIKSRSLLGQAADYNELRFEDKKGSEDWFLHAQKDMHEEVENDHTVTIDHDEIITIKNDQTAEVKHDRKHTVGNDDKLDVKQDGTTSIGQNFKLTAGQQIELITGAASITMKSSGDIEIKGVNIKITGSVSVKVEGQVSVGVKAGASMDVGAGAELKLHSDAMLEVAGSAMTTVKGSMLTLKGDGIAQLSGGITMIG